MALRDDLIRHQVFLQRLVKTEIKATHTAMQDTRKWVGVAIYTDAKGNKIKRIVQTRLADIGKTVVERMQAIAEYEARFTGKILDKYTKYQIEEANKELIKAKLEESKMNVGVNTPPLTMQDSFKDFAKKKSIDVQRTLEASTIAKQPKEEKSRVVEALFAGLITYQLASLIDTSVNNAANAGRASTYETNKNITPRVVWRTELDDSVCPYCEDLEGTEMDSDEFDDAYPAHANCRCFAGPIIEEEVTE